MVPMDPYFPYFPKATDVFFLDFKLYPGLHKGDCELGLP